jgi:hypothetical protein
MRQLVKELNDQYQTAAYNQKVLVAEEVLCIIKHLGGRFLKKQQAEKDWVEVCHSVAVEKISQSFRAIQRKGKRTPRILHAPTPRHLAASTTEQQPNLANAFKHTLPLLQYPSNNLLSQNAYRWRPYDLLLALQERSEGLLTVSHKQASRNGAPSIPMTMATSTFVERELSKEIDSLLHKETSEGGRSNYGQANAVFCSQTTEYLHSSCW